LEVRFTIKIKIALIQIKAIFIGLSLRLKLRNLLHFAFSF
jgi:hypothetical protein